MKAAIISFGHIDEIIVLAGYLSSLIEVEMYIVLDEKRNRESILDLSGIEAEEGLLSEEMTSRALGDEIRTYVQDKFSINIFIYKNFKVSNLKNYKLTYLFSRILRQRGYDLLHFNGNNPQQLLISFLYPRIPKVHTIHDFIGHLGEKKIAGELVNRYLVYGSSQKIFHSRRCIDLIDRKLPAHISDRINFIPSGPVDIFKMWENPSLKQEDNTIISFGRISRYKGIEYLIEAGLMAQKIIPGLKIIIAGEGKFYFDASSLKNNRLFVFLNRYVPNRELVELIQRSAVVVCPYVDATQSGVVITAYAFNKPVIASSVGGLPEIIDDGITGRLVPPGDPEKLSEAIIELLKDPEKTRLMAGNIQKKFTSGKYSWENISKETFKVYQKALKK